MKREAIMQTAVCYWDADEKAYMVESPLFDVIMGVGDTEREAWSTFKNMLDDAYIEYLEGNVVGYEKPGRPPKGGVSFHTLTRPATKKQITAQCKKWGISLGECVEFLWFFYRKTSTDKAAPRPKRRSRTKMSAHTRAEDASSRGQ